MNKDRTTIGLARGARRRLAGAGMLACALVLLAGCNILDVTNPNNVNQEALDNPSAAQAEVNGVVAQTLQGLLMMYGYIESASDNIEWVGSLDGMHEINIGNVRNPFNEFSDDADRAMNPARWLAHQTVQRLEKFQADGQLADPATLAAANLYDAIVYDHIANFYDDFVITSDRMEAGPPVGPSNMITLYDSALTAIDRGLALVGGGELRGQLYAMRARVRFDRAVWQKLNPSGQTPADPLVNDPAAAADADSALALLTPDYWFQLSQENGDLGFGNCSFANCVNSRKEIRFNPDIASYDYTNDVVTVTLKDPINGVPDPVIGAIVTEFAAAQNRSPVTVTSSRAMLLIKAENALANSNTADFASAINAIRGLDGLTSWSGQVSADSILKYERHVNLYLQGRRLNDMYRFGEQSPFWESGSNASQCPGSLFPISKTERATNPNVTEQPACGQ
ncbi:MAG TPA: hypothetical protein VFT57_19365 [Gemmatimonadaceae bacterium]|nr:hypothetical protein [Gemmatimonadaceae bacterium]